MCVRVVGVNERERERKRVIVCPLPCNQQLNTKSYSKKEMAICNDGYTMDALFAIAFSSTLLWWRMNGASEIAIASKILFVKMNSVPWSTFWRRTESMNDSVQICMCECIQVIASITSMYQRKNSQSNMKKYYYIDDDGIWIVYFKVQHHTYTIHIRGLLWVFVNFIPFLFWLFPQEKRERGSAKIYE